MLLTAAEANVQSVLVRTKASWQCEWNRRWLRTIARLRRHRGQWPCRCRSCLGRFRGHTRCRRRTGSRCTRSCGTGGRCFGCEVVWHVRRRLSRRQAHRRSRRCHRSGRAHIAGLWLRLAGLLHGLAIEVLIARCNRGLRSCLSDRHGRRVDLGEHVT